MNPSASTAGASLAAVLAAAGLIGCTADPPASSDPSGGTGGSQATGGSSAGGSTSGAPGVGGGAGSGGSQATGGAAPGSGGAGTSGGTTGNGGAPPLGAGGAPPGDAAAPPFGTKAIAAPPVYRGSVNNSAACSKDYLTSGFEPDDAPGTRHPLFLYFVGTNFLSDEATFRRDTAPAVNAVTEAMARRGFVALNVEYDNGGLAWLSDHVGQLACLFGAANAASALAVACALPQVDCNLGIATWGHSQGAYIAHRAFNHEPRVRAAWLAGYGGDGQSNLPKDRLRVVNGEGDTTNGQVVTVNQIAGFTAAECPDDGRSQCLRPDGSGWVIVRRADCQVSTADHCWFDKVTCTAATPTLEPNWVDPASTKPFALETNADWVAATVRR